MNGRLDGVIRALVLVRIGQEMGSDSTLSRAVHDLATIVISLFR